ncbi:MAG: hypothetical protein EPN93_18790 [Spirochaetes bacterium]|nr:MAG: hypothetical protein EPN93_18790 [Spirochaetota bacterium]
MKRYLGAFVVACAIFVCGDLFAWDNHMMFSKLIFSRDTGLSEKVKAESLQAFIEAEKKNIAAMLGEDEAWLRANLASYAPLPDSLVFKGSASGEALRREFFQALRINPGLPCPLYLQLMPGERHTRAALPHRAVATYDFDIPNPPFEKLNEGEMLGSVDVLATATDEPDYGLDLGLYEDNNTAWGKTYGFGTQPFGNPVYAFGTQAPFHMAFYHENFIINLAASFIKRASVEYRFHEFSSLAALAFKTGHPYWGYRFAGWALHYVQDAAQLYHAVMLPGISTYRLLRAVILKDDQDKNLLLSEVSNKHVVYEDYQYDAMKALTGSGDFKNSILAALTDVNHDKEVPEFYEQYMRDVVTAGVAGRRSRTDTTIVRSFPARYISDPSYIYATTEPGIDLYAFLKAAPEKQKEMDAELSLVFRDMGSYSRKYISWLKAGRPAGGAGGGSLTWMIGAAAVLVLLAAYLVMRRRKAA